MIIYKAFHLSCTQQKEKQFQFCDARLPNDIRQPAVRSDLKIPFT